MPSPQLEDYRQRKAQGLCATCGKAPPEENRTRCGKCRERKSQQLAHKRATVPSGTCSQCFRRPSRKGIRSCGPCAERCRIKSIRRYHEVRQEVLTRYGGKCACCSNSNFKYLQLDHIDGGGRIERAANPGVRGGNFFKTLYKMKTLRKDLQVLCANCHQAKTYGGCTPEDHAL